MRLKAGFTLIELIVATTIVVMVSGIGLVSYRQANEKARDGRRQADLETIKQALVLYRVQFGSYPNVTSSNPVDQMADYQSELTGERFLTESLIDPQSAQGRNYEAPVATAQSFELCADLESGEEYCVVSP